MRTYGKVLLSAYLVNKIKAVGSEKNKGLLKYGELVLGAYILERLKSEKSQREIEPEALEPEAPVESEALIEPELNKSGKGYSMRFGRVVMGALIGITAMYALKKHSAKKSGHKVAVE